MKAVITDEIVAKLHGFGEMFIFPPGEKFKTRETKALLEDQLLEAGFNRSGTLIGLGGGVVTDMAGFIAATFMRGVELVLIPTTLLAMVDAAIGGKNGVNTPFGKNLIGSFYEPKEMIIDLKYLKTLPEKEMKQGIAEMIKHGFLAGDDYLKEGITEKTILRSGQIKRDLIGSDLLDRTQRMDLNFGHTIGHAIEQVSDYTISHGFAVAMGMAAEAFLLKELNILAPSKFYSLIEEIEKYQLPTTIPALSHEALLKQIRRDKKGKFSLIKERVEEPLIRRALCWHR